MIKLIKLLVVLVTVPVLAIGIVAIFGWLNSDIEPVVITPDPNPGFTGEFEVNRL